VDGFVERDVTFASILLLLEALNVLEITLAYVCTEK